MLEHLGRLFAYDGWANGETLRSLERAANPPETALRRMAHIVGTEWLWISRLREERSPLAVWPALTIAQCKGELERLAAAWRKDLSRMSENSLSRRVSYVNTKGEIWDNSAGDILMHAVLHAGYHRGQVASDLRAAGFEPAYTDYIHAVRQHLV
ncbi:MAG TPA: DinB family protein [Thermoanaerobaculia bacterium]|nr:DinB family protein [Thermoanaerobaculia bacterium]